MGVDLKADFDEINWSKNDCLNTSGSNTRKGNSGQAEWGACCGTILSGLRFFRGC